MATTIMEGESDNPDFTGFVWQGEAYEGLTCDALEWISSFGGGTIISPEGEIEVFNDQAIAALETGCKLGRHHLTAERLRAFQEEDAQTAFSKTGERRVYA